MATLEIIGAPQSNFVRTTRIACIQKRVPYTLTPARPHTPEVDAIHPLGKIPVMRHGGVTLCESAGICVYIDRTFDGPLLIPRDATSAARAVQWILLHNTAIDPLWVRQYLRAYFFLRVAGWRSRSRHDRCGAAKDARDVCMAGSGTRFARLRRRR